MTLANESSRSLIFVSAVSDAAPRHVLSSCWAAFSRSLYSVVNSVAYSSRYTHTLRFT
jgi:hypothetical protein